MHASSSALPVVILISGSGRNLQAFLDEAAAGRLDIDIRAVISNKADAYGLTRAAAAGVPTAVVDHTQYSSREDFDDALAKKIDTFAPKLVILAGFMRILTANFANHYLGRMLNVHPSLLPAYRGLNTYQRALDDGGTEHGVSVHFVTPELDGGPVVIQASTNILANDTVDSLTDRIHQQELIIYPAAVQAFAKQQIQLNGHNVLLNDKVLALPLRIRQTVSDPAERIKNDYTNVYENLFEQTDAFDPDNADQVGTQAEMQAESQLIR